MQEAEIYQCQCTHCRQPGDHPDKLLHRQMNLLLGRLDEQERRWYVALESKKLGRGGDRFMSVVTGMHVQTIRRGREELDAELQGRPTDRIRLPGGGRPPVEKKLPPSSKI
jgi:hypothetical protein